MTSPSPTPAPTPDGLTPQQRETWFAWMRVTLRLAYEMSHQLQVDSGLSLNDFHVLNALADSPDERLQIGALSARIGWERSRLSHHLRRMDARGLVTRSPSRSDGRGIDVVLTEPGRAALVAATPAHVGRVRELFFDGLDPQLVPGLAAAMKQIQAQLLAHGTLPAPGEPQQGFPGLGER